MKNLFALPPSIPEEIIEVLTESATVRIERIISNGHASPEGFWYDQPKNEWVIVLKGKAQLLLEGDREPVMLGPGDWIDIRAHQKHRVAWTTPDEPTVWLALFYA